MDDLSLARLDATAQAELVQRGELSAVELLTACRERVERVDPLIRAVVASDWEAAHTRAQGVPSGPFAGVPFLVKDVAPYPGLPYRLGSRLFAQNVAREAVPYTQRLDDAGLLTFGKSATSEFGMLGSTETLLHGVTHNPWDLTLSATGSSGGAAAAVAAGLVPMAHASDGGGSIRIPAAAHGLFGFMPSRGRCVPMNMQQSDFSELILEHCISRSVRDSLRFLACTQRRDAEAPFAPITAELRAQERPLRIGVLRETMLGGAPEPEIDRTLTRAAELCSRLGHALFEVSLASREGRAAGEAFFDVGAAGLAGLFGMLEGMLGRPVGRDDVEPFTWQLVAGRRARLAEAVPAARALFTRASESYRALFTRCDVVLSPTLATGTWQLGELSPTRDHDALIERTARSVCYTPIHNMSGCPAMSVPLFWSARGQPLGSHFAAAPGQEELLFRLALQLEAEQPWHARWAPFSYPVLFGE